MLGRPIDQLIPLLAEPPDLSVLQDAASWKTARENADRFGVAALVAYAVRPHISPAERIWCDRVLTDNWTRHERMLRHLEFVSGLFADEGIPSISLKGPLLAQRYYTPAFLRKPSMDLDLAVIEHDLARACQALTRAGYTVAVPIAAATALTHHVELFHPSRPKVELHFRLSHQSLGIPVNQFFERAVSCSLPSGLKALILGPADQLLHLVLHLATSRFGTLFHLYEIRRAFRAEPLSVRTEAIGRAVDHHYCGVLRMTDIAFRARLGEPFLPPETPVPATWLNWRLTPRLYQAFESWSVPGREVTLTTRFRGRWLDCQITDRLVDAIRTAALFVKSARAQVAEGRAWGPVRNLTYGPRSR
jgi:hypothetical protein